MTSFQFNSKEKDNYSYLKDCFKKSTAENFDVEIPGIGEVKLNNRIEESTSLSYFEVPKNKLSEKPSDLVKKVADYYVETWKNNSKIIKQKAFKTNGSNAFDLRLHLNLEDFDMQEIIILDNGKIYILTATEDGKNPKHFDNLVKLIKDKKCPK